MEKNWELFWVFILISFGSTVTVIIVLNSEYWSFCPTSENVWILWKMLNEQRFDLKLDVTIIWHVYSPHAQYSIHNIYFNILHIYLFFFFLSILTWLVHRRSYFSYIFCTLLFSFSSLQYFSLFLKFLFQRFILQWLQIHDGKYQAI